MKKARGVISCHLLKSQAGESEAQPCPESNLDDTFSMPVELGLSHLLVSGLQVNGQASGRALFRRTTVS